MNFALIFRFARQDLKDRYAGSMLGGLWAFIMPLVNIIIFAVIFSQIMGAKLESFGAELSRYGYSIYLISGILAWNSFSGITQRVTNCFHEKRDLISKIHIPLSTLPLYILISETFVLLVSYVFFMIFLLIIGFDFSIYWFLLPLIYLTQTLFAYALGFFLSILGVFIRDIRELVPVGMQLWFWLTPIVYVVSILPDSIRPFFILNPMVHIISSYRSLIIDQAIPSLTPLFLILGASISLILINHWMLKKLERDIRDMV